MNSLIIAKTPQESVKLSSLCRQGKLRRLYHGIYTSNLSEPLEKIATQHWMPIVAHVVPGGILSFRTAMEVKPTPFLNNQQILFVISSYNKTVVLPGLVIKVIKGNKEEFCDQIAPHLARSTPARFLLENLVPTRAPLKEVKTVGQEGVEHYLTKEMRFRTEKILPQLRDEAREVAQKLNLQKEFEQLNKIIAALLSSHPEKILQTSYARTAARKEPFDINRIKLFKELSFYLKRCKFKQRPYQFNSASFRNLSFFESYFSNFIEGTEFLIDEAEDIVFSGNEIQNRHADSHDVLANFYLANDFMEMSITPSRVSELITILQDRHALLMKERPDKLPGEF